MSKLFVMTGIPGSGKSTFIKSHIDNKTQTWISRDAVRFAMLNEDDEYFSKEKQVFGEYIRRINTSLQNGLDVYADATHLNEVSRNKLLRAIIAKPSSIECIWMRVPLEVALDRNEQRVGTKYYVPRGVIRRMNTQLTKPSFEEGFTKIYEINEDGNIIIRVEE